MNISVTCEDDDDDKLVLQNSKLLFCRTRLRQFLKGENDFATENRSYIFRDFHSFFLRNSSLHFRCDVSEVYTQNPRGNISTCTNMRASDNQPFLREKRNHFRKNRATTPKIYGPILELFMRKSYNLQQRGKK